MYHKLKLRAFGINNQLSKMHFLLYIGKPYIGLLNKFSGIRTVRVSHLSSSCTFS